MTELFELPQIVSGRTAARRGAGQRAVPPADRHASSTLTPEEAELAKLFTNVWRYIKFAAANQFYMMANDRGLDFERIRQGLSQRLPAGRRHARAPGSPPGRACSRTPCSWPRSTTTTSRSATRRCRSTRACRCTSCTGWSSGSTWRPMTVGILGMAFKGESRRHPLQPVLQAQARSCGSRPDGCSAPTRTSPSTRTWCRWTRCSAEADLLVIARAASRVPRPGDRQAGRRHLEPARAAGYAADHERARASRSSSRPTTRASDIVPCLDRLFESRHAALRGPGRRRRPRRHHGPGGRGVRQTGARLRAWSTPTAAGPPTPSGSASTRAAAAGRRGHHGRRLRRPAADRRAGPAGRAGRGVAAASRYMPGGQQVGGPLLKGTLSRTAGPLAATACPRRHAGRDQLVQGVLDRLRARGRHRLARRLRDRHRARPPRPSGCGLPVAEIPTIWLDRPTGVSNFKLASGFPSYLRWYRFAFGPR